MTLPAWLGSLFLIFVGGGTLAIAYRGYLDGELPAGSNWLRPFRPRRNENPLAFHFFLALYFGSGMALTIWGLLIVVGVAPPLKLH